MVPNRDEPMTQSSTQSGVTPGAIWPQAILFSGIFTIWPLHHEQQLHPFVPLPQGVTSPQGLVEPPHSNRNLSAITNGSQPK